MITLHSWKSANSLKALSDGCVVVMGNFDGCHKAHRKLIEMALSSARTNHLPALCLTFSPHPRFFFKNLSPHSLLFTDAQKSRALKELGIDIHLAQSFDQEFADLSADDFIHKVLLEALRCEEVFVGERFRFGKNRSAGTQELRDHLTKRQKKVSLMDPQLSSHQRLYSSSLIRELMSKGDLTKLTHYLGRPLLFEGKIQKGKGLAQTWGYPTANLAVHPEYPLQNGVYSALVSIEPEEKRPIFICSSYSKNLKPAVINKGLRPTLHPHPERAHQSLAIEVHILKENLHLQPGDTLGIYFVKRLRDEQTFPSTEDLTEQISKDIQSAEKSLENFSLSRGGVG